MAKTRDNVPATEITPAWAEFSGKVNLNLWPALKGRLSADDQAKFANDRGAIIKALRSGFTTTAAETSQGVTTSNTLFGKLTVESVPQPYPNGFRFRSIEEQLIRLAPFFPGLNASKIALLDLPPLPTQAEAYMVFPLYIRLVAFGSFSDYTYGRALRMMIKKNRLALRPSCKGFVRYHISGHYLQISKRTNEALRCSTSADYDYIVCPVQVSKRHLGSLPNKALVDLLPNEFCLGPLEIRCLLISHPELADMGTYQCLGVHYRRDLVYPYNRVMTLVGSLLGSRHEDVEYHDGNLYTPTGFII
ncbi:TPA: hypothetical protein DEB72_03330 [Patescibacteria group bacterium]|nr:hypothetical protein [Patescibacteria group bacterium]